MMGIYGYYVLFACCVPFSLNVSKQRWKEAGEIPGKIRKLVALTLGLATVGIALVGATRG